MNPEFFQRYLDILTLNSEPNIGEIAILSSLVFFLFSIALQSLSKAPAKLKKEEVKPEIKSEEVEIEKTKEPSVSWSDRLKKGLSSSRNQVWGKIGSLLNSSELTDEIEEEIEELLYSSDMSGKSIQEILKHLRESFKKGDSFKDYIHSYLKERMEPVQSKVSKDILKAEKQSKTKVIMIVGVNGAGKTTSLGKLATRLKREGAHVVVGACDTFRAAAVEQLEVWCKRADVEMIRAKDGADPSGVAYETLQTAINKKADYCLLDTAGRLQNNVNLMEELKKTKRVLSKLDDSAPDEVLLVIDSITGQNALQQAKAFNESLNLTGLIFTKCDGSSKAGNAVSIVEELKVPIAYIGVGEDVDDLDRFDLDDYLSALLG